MSLTSAISYVNLDKPTKLENMQNFLATVCNHIYSQHQNMLSKLCIVFPNRRAGLFFNKYLEGHPYLCRTPTGRT